MLQQTQVARVVERFEPFLRRFPSPRALASADEQVLLREWSGLGYYRRARGLHAAARTIVRVHGGAVPDRTADLLALPGIGRYTAAAVSSLAFGHAEPAVDANVRRVILRIDGVHQSASTSATDRAIWKRAAALVAHADAPGVHTEALMELGATVCTARKPACGKCPLRGDCIAAAKGTQDRAQRITRRAPRTVIDHAVVLARDAAGWVLIEQRPDHGLWASQWQAPTLETAQGEGRPPSARRIASWLGVARVIPARQPGFTFLTTHRVVRFTLWEVPSGEPAAPARGRFMAPAKALALPLTTPQRRILLRFLDGTSAH